jgi:hypothetical protein
MTEQTSALATTSDTLEVFTGITAFDNAQRMAKALSSSTLVPKEYQGQQGLANSLIALEMSGRMRLSPLTVMQNMSIIHGRPSWSSSFLIAMVNESGKFTPLRFIFDNDDAPTWCYAEAKDKASGEVLRGEKITLELAKKEGWSTKNGSKWQTMPGQMLRYRAASFWTRVYYAQATLGIMTQEEVIDVEQVSVELSAPTEPAKPPEQIAAEQPPGPVEVVEVPVEEEPKANPLGEGLAAIPRLTDLRALDGAQKRVIELVAAGEITDADQAKLEAAIAKRRAELK